MVIEINLAPRAAGARLRPSRLSAPSLPSLLSFGANTRRIAVVVAALAAVVFAVLNYLQLGARQIRVEGRIEQEVTDSARYAATIAVIQSMQARHDSITQRIEVIRGIDTRRFVWPHVLDEISLSVPPHVWLSEIASVESSDPDEAGPLIAIQGSAGSPQSLTRFMTSLEGSTFVEDVTLLTTEQQEMQGRTVQRFSLEARYRVPDPSAIQTVPVVLID